MAQVRAFILKDGKVGKNLGEIYVADLKPDQYMQAPIRTGVLQMDHQQMIPLYLSISKS